MILNRSLHNNQLNGTISSSIGSLINLSLLYVNLIPSSSSTLDDACYRRLWAGASTTINWAAPFHHRLALSWIFRSCTLNPIPSTRYSPIITNNTKQNTTIDTHIGTCWWWWYWTGTSTTINWVAPFHHRLALSWIFSRCTSIQCHPQIFSNHHQQQQAEYNHDTCRWWYWTGASITINWMAPYHHRLVLS